MEPFDEFADLRAAWLAAPATAPALPDAATIAAQARRGRRRLLLTSGLALAALAATLILITWGGLTWEFRFPTTYFGLVLAGIAVAAAVAVNTGLLRLLLGSTDSATDARAYLAQLHRYRAQHRRLQTAGMQAYFALLGAGMGLYLYEFAVRSLTFGLWAYGLTFGWFAVVWVWLRPRAIRKQNAALDALIGQAEALAGQLGE